MKLIHTADWQIGMQAVHAGASAERVREARLEAAARVVALTREHAASALLLAGDTFEDNAVDSRLVRRVAELLRQAACPVFVLPGNHDPLVPGNVFELPVWAEVKDRVQVLRSSEPVDLEGAVLLPCPCVAKLSSADPTRQIPPREEGDARIRIGVAHGSMEGMGFTVKPSEHPIAADAAERAGVDYLALGHWHSPVLLPSADQARVAYSGTPETASFGERDSGYALLVDLPEAGAPVRVTVRPTGTLTWLQLSRELESDEDLTRLREEIDGTPAPDSTLLELTLTGHLTRAGFEALEQLEEAAEVRFLSARILREEVQPVPEDPESWIAALPEGVARIVAERLLEQAQDPGRREVATRALTRLVAMARRAGR